MVTGTTYLIFANNTGNVQNTNPWKEIIQGMITGLAKPSFL
jgi:hypothetical protein